MSRNIKRTASDASFSRTLILPAGVGSTTTSGIHLHDNTTRGDFVNSPEIHLAAPALAVGLLANGETVTYALEDDDDPAFGSPRALATILVQTRAGGVGAAAADAAVRLASDVRKNVRVKATKTGATDASAASASVVFVFEV